MIIAQIFKKEKREESRRYIRGDKQNLNMMLYSPCSRDVRGREKSVLVYKVGRGG